MKKIIIISLVLALGILAIGCTKNTEPTTDGNVVVDEPDENETEEYEYDTVGRIIEIDGDDLHVMSGDVVDIFTVDNAEDFYINQEVEIKNINGSKTCVEFTRDDSDFEVKHDYMGFFIESISGTIEKIEELSSQGMLTVINYDISVQTENGIEVFNVMNINGLNIGDNVVVEYVNSDKVSYVYAIYNADDFKEYDVLAISKSQRGTMLVETAEGVFEITNMTDINMNMSDIVEGAKVEIYLNPIPEMKSEILYIGK